MRDKQIENLIKAEDKRQKSVINLIASENIVSPDVLTALGSILQNKYAEGYPGKRYYQGCEFVDMTEQLAIDRAKEENMPADNIERAVKRGTGELEGVVYEECRYEGYGIGGAAVMVDCLTDNKVRTVAEVRHAFNKYGGNMGTDGCVAFQFKHCGYLIFAPGTNEDAIMEAALEAGAEDVVTHDDGAIEVITPPYEFMQVKEALEKAGFKAEMGEVTMKPQNETELTGDDATKMQKLLDILDSLDDVQEVYTSAQISE